MAKTIYKTLLEVRLLHEFYLTDSNGDTLFDVADASARTGLLQQRIDKGLPSITADLLFEVPGFLNTAFRNYRLRLLTTYSGYEIVTEVRETLLPDGTSTYTPVAQLPDDLNLSVIVYKKTSRADAVTNSRMKEAMPFAWFFTNDDLPTAKVFPFLSGSIAAYDTAAVYEQGELASYGPGDIRQYNGKTNGWDPIIGNEYASPADRLVVPWQFDYRFASTDIVKKATFELQDASGVLVRSFMFSDANPLSKVTLNFRNDKRLIPPLPAIKTGEIYTLNVTINDTSTTKSKLLFFEGYDSLSNLWAIINIRPKVANADFNLGAFTPAPVFEIWIKSRLTYWRYVNDKSKKLIISDNTKDYVEVAGNNLVTKDPRAATWIPTLFNKLDYLPNPVSYDRTAAEGSLLFTDVPVPESKMFPVDTS